MIESKTIAHGEWLFRISFDPDGPPMVTTVKTVKGISHANSVEVELATDGVKFLPWHDYQHDDSK